MGSRASLGAIVSERMVVMKADTREIVISRNCGLDVIQDPDIVIAYIKEKYQKTAFFYNKISDEEKIFDSVTGHQINSDEYVRKIDYPNINYWFHVDVISLKDYGHLVKRNSFDVKDNITEIVRHELYGRNVDRENPVLIKVAKALYWSLSELKVIQIPKNIEYDIILSGETHECIVEKGHYWD